MLTELEFLNASAGSGKTTKLIAKLKDLLLTYKASDLVAITFTESAAREIKERVIKEFAETDRVDEVSKINISTMHSFFSKILRENAILLNLSPNYQILDANNAASIIENIIQSVYIEFLNNSDYKFIYSVYSYENIKKILYKLNSKYYLIYKKLKTYEDYLEEENLYLLAYFKKTFTSFLDDYNNISKISETDIVENFTNEVKKTFLTLKDFEARFYQVLHNNEVEALKLLVNDLINLEISINNNYRPTSKFKNENETLAVLLKKSLKNIDTFLKSLKEDIQFFNSDFIKGSASVLSLFINMYQSFRTKYESFKKSIDSLDFDDLEILAYKLINENSDVAKKYKKKLKCILVDEFQDTNKLQVDLIFAISTKLFLVGDAKQSIYGFRNADLRVFNEVFNKYKDSSVSLNNNYRSSKGVINFVNEVSTLMFNDIKESEHFLNYENMIPTKNELGRVEIIDVSSEGRDHIKAELCTIKNIILKNKDEFCFDDYYILLKNNRYIPLISKYLSENNIPNTVVGEANYLEIFRLIYGVINGVLNPYNNFYFMELTRLPKFYLSEKFLYNFKDSLFYEEIFKKVEVNTTSSDDSLSLLNLQKLFENFKAKNFNNLCDILNFILNETGLVAAVNKFYGLNDLDLKYIILDLANNNADKNIYEFLDLLKKYKPKDDLSLLKNNKVKILTVHKAKGLENKVVIMPLLHLAKSSNEQLVISSDGDISIKLPINYTPVWKKSAKYDTISEDENKKQLFESMRLLYVALTRAKDSLYLISSFKEEVKEDAKFKWNDFIAKNFRDKITFHENILEPDNSLLLRKIYIDKNIYEPKTDTAIFTRKVFISQIKDFVYCPQLFLRNLIFDDYKTTLKENLFGKEVHESLENYNINSSEADTSKVNNFIKSELGIKVFAARNYLVEHDFLYEFNNLYFRGRIDRINIYEDSVWLIDYKTSIDENDNRLLSSLKAQIIFYAYYVKKTFLNKKIKISLIDVSKLNELIFDENIEHFMQNVLKEFLPFLEKKYYQVEEKNCHTCIVEDKCMFYKA